MDSKTVVDRYSAENLFRGAVCYFSSCRPTTLESTIGNFWETEKKNGREESEELNFEAVSER